MTRWAKSFLRWRNCRFRGDQERGAGEFPLPMAASTASTSRTSRRRFNTTPDEIVARHVAGDYRVAMIGFTPGWSYLSGLEKTLHMSRRQNPRLLTPAGTISIGGVQTGVQCLAGPSGWHLLGRTAVRTYQLHRDPIFLLEPGDGVTFSAVDAKTFAEQDRAAEAGEIVAELMPHEQARGHLDRSGKLGAGRRTLRLAALRPDAERRDGSPGAGGGQYAGRKRACSRRDRGRPVRRGLYGPRRRGPRRAGRRFAQRRYRRARRWRSTRSMTLAEGETLTLGFARGGSFSYLAIEGGIAGEPMFGSLAVNARAGLGSPYPRPLQAGDELQVAAASGAAERRIEMPAQPDAPIRVVMGPQDDEFPTRPRSCSSTANGRYRRPATAWAIGSKAPSSRHLHGHNIVSDGTVNGSIQVPGNGQPIVLMPDRGTSGGYPKIATVISADFGRFAQIPAGRAFASRPSAWPRRRPRREKFAELLRTLPDRLRAIENVDLNIEALQRCQCRRQRGQCRRCRNMAD